MSAVSDNPALLRALRRARWLHWGLVGLILVLGLGALQNGGRVQVMKRRLAESERRLRLMEARQMREAGVPGWERRVEESLEAARESGQDLALRDEWIAWSAALGSRSASALPLFRTLQMPQVAGKPVRVDGLAFSNTPTRLMAAGPEGIWSWDLQAPGAASPPPLVVAGASVPIGRARADAPAEDLVARVNSEGRVQLAEPASGKVALTLTDPASLRVRWLAWSPDGRWLAVAGHSETRSPSAIGGMTVALWDIPGVRSTLDAAGLGWPTGKPTGFKSASADPDQWIHTTRFLLGGVLVFVVMGAAIANQHLLLRRYEQAERAAVERARELEEARSRMAQAEKMRALGTLAAGVAHDFNNLLSVIQMSRQLVQRSLRPTGTDREHLEQIGLAVEQGRSVVRSILGYSRDPATSDGQAPIRSLIGDTLVLLQRQFLSGVEVTHEVAPAIAGFQVRRGRLEPILVNLLVNAAEAMGGRGTLRISAVLTAEGRGLLRETKHAGPWVCLSVTDSGPGIAPDVLPHIFEPFFTTKKLGGQRGTGLGLATVWRIAEESDFGLRVESVLGRGTRFDVLIPFTPEADISKPVCPLS